MQGGCFLTEPPCPVDFLGSTDCVAPVHIQCSLIKRFVLKTSLFSPVVSLNRACVTLTWESFRGCDFILEPTAATFGELHKRENLVDLPNTCVENNISKHLHLFCLIFV